MKLRFQRGLVPLPFSTLPEPLTNFLSIVRLRPPQVKVFVLDTHRNMLMSPDSQPALTSSHNKRLLLFSAAGREEPKLGTKWSSFEKRSTIYVQTTLERKKLANSQEKPEDSADSDDVKEEYIVIESKPAAFSTLSKKRRTAMCKLVKELTPCDSFAPWTPETWRKSTSLTSKKI